MSEQIILKELRSMKTKMVEMDKELHRLREEFEDTHMSIEERETLFNALDDEKNGKTVSLAEMRKRLGF